MTREEYEKIIDEKLKAVKEELMVGFKEEPSLDGWKVGDRYYYPNVFGGIGASIVTRCSAMNGEILDETDAFMIRHGYAKRTQEEVQFQIERDAVLYELRKFAEPKDRKWNGDKHYYITWNYGNNRVCIEFVHLIKGNDIYFASREDAEKAIEEIGESRIRKYYLMVGDDE